MYTRQFKEFYFNAKKKSENNEELSADEKTILVSYEDSYFTQGKEINTESPLANYQKGLFSAESVEKALENTKDQLIFIPKEEEARILGDVIDEAIEEQKTFTGALIKRLTEEHYYKYYRNPEGESEKEYEDRFQKGLGFLHALSIVKEFVEKPMVKHNPFKYREELFAKFDYETIKTEMIKYAIAKKWVFKPSQIDESQVDNFIADYLFNVGKITKQEYAKSYAFKSDIN